jgi:hypothetical protein
MGFIQIIEFTSTRPAEVTALLKEWTEANQDTTTARAGYQCADRDKPNTYVNIVHFDSYESAMENSANPATSEFAERMQALCDGPPSFRNLDVVFQGQ